MTRSRHPNKEIEHALQYAQAHGWRIVPGGSHAWGRIYCPDDDEGCRCGEFCIASIWSTPKNPKSHARAIRRVVNNCIKQGFRTQLKKD